MLFVIVGYAYRRTKRSYWSIPYRSMLASGSQFLWNSENFCCKTRPNTTSMRLYRLVIVQVSDCTGECLYRWVSVQVSKCTCEWIVQVSDYTGSEWLYIWVVCCKCDVAYTEQVIHEQRSILPLIVTGNEIKTYLIRFVCCCFVAHVAQSVYSALSWNTVTWPSVWLSLVELQ